MPSTVSIPNSKGKFLNAIHKKPVEVGTDELEYTLAIMIHGFPGHKSSQNDLFGDIESILHEKGFHTLRFDFQGCGKSEGDPKDFTIQTAVEDLKSVIRWARSQHYKNFIFISEGFGTTVAMLTSELRVRSHIMLWPAINPKALGEMHENSDKFEKTFLNSLKRIKIGQYIKEIVMPALIMHGVRDDLYPVEQLDLIRKHSNSKRIEITTFHDGVHGLTELKHRKMVFYHIGQFLEKFS